MTDFATARESIMAHVRDADDAILHGGLVFQVEQRDGFDMTDTELVIGDLLAEDKIRDVAPENHEPAYEVA